MRSVPRCRIHRTPRHPRQTAGSLNSGALPAPRPSHSTPSGIASAAERRFCRALPSCRGCSRQKKRNPDQGAPHKIEIRCSNAYSSKSLSQVSGRSPPPLNPASSPRTTPKKPYFDNSGFSYAIRSLCFISTASTKDNFIYKSASRLTLLSITIQMTIFTVTANYTAVIR